MTLYAINFSRGTVRGYQCSQGEIIAKSDWHDNVPDCNIDLIAVLQKQQKELKKPPKKDR